VKAEICNDFFRDQLQNSALEGKMHVIGAIFLVFCQTCIERGKHILVRGPGADHQVGAFPEGKFFLSGTRSQKTV
jgi:hypothetical protein